jgi:transposase
VVGTRADLERALAERDAENRELRSRIERFQSLIEKLTSTNGHLANKISKLTEEVAGLRAQLARALGNAPETPSGQTPTYLKPSRARTGRIPGRREGHPGACRRPPPEPDREEDHTLTRCPHCEGGVRPVRDTTFEPVCRFRYVEDVLPGTSEVAKHRVRQYWCRRCKRKVEPAVTAALPGATLGIRVMVWSAVQHFVHATPTLKIVAMLRSEYGFEVTSGGLHAAWHKLAVFLYAEYDGILGKIRVAGALHADETGWRINGTTGWLWCFATKQEVGYLIDQSRSSTVATFVLGKEFGGTLIQDFYAAYNACQAAETQYCLAHLLREFDKVEARQSGHMTAEFAAYRDQVAGIVRAAIKFHRNCTDPPAREAARIRFERRLLKVLEEPARDKDVVRITKRLWRSAHGLFTFLTAKGVDPTNNHAEREIRAAVVMRKISGGSRSDRGADTRAVLMSIFRTQQLRGLDPVQATIDLTQRTIVTEHAKKRPGIASHR